MTERGRTLETTTAAPGAPEAGSLPARNRRTAAALIAWILGLMLVSALVAWLRN